MAYVRTPGGGSSGTPATSPAAISKITSPMWIAHRGGGSYTTYSRGPVPENTLEGARAIVEAATAAGINVVLNFDVRELQDGSLAVIHDPTLDRSTTSTGNVADQTSQSWAGIVTDAGAWHGAVVWGNLKTPLFDDYLREFGGKVPLVIGAYTPGGSTVGAKITARLVARGLQSTAIVEAFSTAQLTPARDAGIATRYLPPAEGQAGADATSILATGVWAAGLPKRVGVDAETVTNTYVTSLITAGLTVAVYNTARRYDRDRFLALGVTEFISDDVVYQATSTRVANTGLSTVDPLTLGIWPHGLLEGDQARGRGKLVNGGVQLDYVTSTGTQVVSHGSFCPLPSPNYTLAADIIFDTLDSDTSRHASIVFAAPDDRMTSQAITVGKGATDGYQFLIRETGAVAMFKLSQSAQTSSGVTPASGPALTTATIVAGTPLRLSIAVTASTITVNVTISGTTYGPWAYTDTTYRGSYFYFVKATAGTTRGVVTFKNTTVS